MNLSTLKAAQGMAITLGSATKHIGAAACQMGKLALPVAGAALVSARRAAGSTFDRARNAETSDERRRAAASLGIGVAVVVGLSVATFAHFASKHRKNKAYRVQRRQIKAAVAREREIDSAIREAVAMRPAQDVLDPSFASEVSYASAPGCYAILTYDPDVAGSDMSAFRDVYVGAAPSMLEGVRRQLGGEGNLYVHADVVYKRPVYVGFYPCDEGDLAALRNELLIALGADESYNKVDFS